MRRGKRRAIQAALAQHNDTAMIDRARDRVIEQPSQMLGSTHCCVRPENNYVCKLAVLGALYRHGPIPRAGSQTKTRLVADRSTDHFRDISSREFSSPVYAPSPVEPAQDRCNRRVPFEWLECSLRFLKIGTVWQVNFIQQCGRDLAITGLPCTWIRAECLAASPRPLPDRKRVDGIADQAALRIGRENRSGASALRHLVGDRPGDKPRIGSMSFNQPKPLSVPCRGSRPLASGQNGSNTAPCPLRRLPQQVGPAMQFASAARALWFHPHFRAIR